jgi:hypothetical protein
LLATLAGIGVHSIEMCSHPPSSKGTTTIIVTYIPSISRAFPEWGAVADMRSWLSLLAETAISKLVGRIIIDQWPRLKKWLDRSHMGGECPFPDEIAACSRAALRGASGLRPFVAVRS